MWASCFQDQEKPTGCGDEPEGGTCTTRGRDLDGGGRSLPASSPGSRKGRSRKVRARATQHLALSSKWLSAGAWGPSPPGRLICSFAKPHYKASFLIPHFARLPRPTPSAAGALGSPGGNKARKPQNQVIGKKERQRDGFQNPLLFLATAFRGSGEGEFDNHVTVPLDSLDLSQVRGCRAKLDGQCYKTHLCFSSVCLSVSPTPLSFPL